MSYSSTEAGIISLDAGSRSEGNPALNQRDLTVDVLEPTLERELLPGGKQKKKLQNSVTQFLENIQSVPQNAHMSSHRVSLFIF